MFSKLYKFSKLVMYLNSCQMDLGLDSWFVFFSYSLHLLRLNVPDLYRKSLIFSSSFYFFFILPSTFSSQPLLHFFSFLFLFSFLFSSMSDTKPVSAKIHILARTTRNQ